MWNGDFLGAVEYDGSIVWVVRDGTQRWQRLDSQMWAWQNKDGRWLFEPVPWARGFAPGRFSGRYLDIASNG